MPRVGKTHYPYTKKGKAAAKRAKMKRGGTAAKSQARGMGTASKKRQKTKATSKKRGSERY